MMFLTTGHVEKCQELGRMFLGPEVRSVVPVAFDCHPETDFTPAVEEDE